MKKSLVSLFTVISLLMISCSSSYDTMVQDFNKDYCVPESKPMPENSITEPGFVADSMLQPRYLFKDGYEVSLTAPSGGKSYNWELVYKVTSKYSSEEKEERKSICSKQSYSFMPGEDFAIGTENKLVLTVTDESGTEYIDTTIVIITSW